MGGRRQGGGVTQTCPSIGLAWPHPAISFTRKELARVPIGVEAAPGDAEDAAEPIDRERLSGLLHEPELHFRSSAKYAKAFFKMSRSWVTSRSLVSRSRMRCACGASRPRPGNASRGVVASCSFQRCSKLRAMPRLVATSFTDFPSTVTRRTASLLNCGVNVRRTRVG